MKFSRIRLPGPLFSRQAHVDELHAILDTFVLIAEPKELSARRFALERGAIAGSSARADFDWAGAWERAAAMRPDAADPEEALAALLRARHTAPSPHHFAQALAKIDSVPAKHASLLAGALTWVNQQRIAPDERQATALRELREELRDDAFLVRVTAAVLEGLVEPVSAPSTLRG